MDITLHITEEQLALTQAYLDSIHIKTVTPLYFLSGRAQDCLANFFAQEQKVKAETITNKIVQVDMITQKQVVDILDTALASKTVDKEIVSPSI